MTTFTVKQYDEFPIIDEVLLDGNGDPIDLTGVTAIYLHVAGGTAKAPGTVLIHREAVIVDATQVTDPGRVQFSWNTDAATGETDVPGKYIREWQIDWGSAGTQRVPTGGDDKLVIFPAAAVDD